MRSVSSSRSNRSAIGTTGTPSPSCSRSYHDAPMPSRARPLDRTSRVVTIFASSPGWRYITPVTSTPSVIRWVSAATYPSVVYASSIGSSADAMPSIWK